MATLLGEYFDSPEADLPSAAVVAMLREFGISEASARSALSRLIRRGLIATRRVGRQSTYHITPQTIASHRAYMHRFLTFGAEPPPWTGDWTVVAFSLPEPGQAHRHHVRKTLGALGFVRLYDSVWIKPGREPQAPRQAMSAILADVERARWSVMCAQFDEESGPHGPAAAYDLDCLATAYRAFIDQYSGVRDAVHAGEVDTAQAFVVRTSVMDSWRSLVLIDPDLPEHLLPAPWPRQHARETFLDIHAALGPLAEARLVEVATPYWPAAASWVNHFRLAKDSSLGISGGTRDA
ncbi:PaaX family transcriptional regulator C-terminal domain-containing protein [Luedemannella helvata]|uniref:PaaX family transcriptional regulator C-terminal domain-containing protein n=1 Tax=Luedemannella helvata TaxID=349315 RepID=A0ABN2L645_9ACTN